MTGRLTFEENKSQLRNIYVTLISSISINLLAFYLFCAR